MSKKHTKYLDRKDSEDSNRSFKEPNSIIYQIPMNYKTYQEMKEGSTRTSSRPGTNYTNNMSSQSAGNLKLLMETDESTMRTKSKHENFESIKTPIFNANKVNEGLNEVSQGTQQTRTSISHRGNTHKTEEERYTKRVFDSAIQTANKLKTQKEKLGRYMDQVLLLEEEISKNARRCLADFNERHNKALEQLEKYFYTHVTRIKDVEAEKKDYLQSKHFMGRNHMQELSTLINTLEAKIQGEPGQIPMQIYEDKAAELEKYISKLSYDDMFLDKRWKDFQVPPLELNLSATGTTLNPPNEDNSEMASLLKGHDLDPISINKRTHSVLSPKMLINLGDISQVGKNRFEQDPKDRKGTGRDKHETGNQPLKYLQAVDLSKDERERKHIQAEKEEVPRERHTSYHRESTRGENLPLKSERLSYDNKKSRREEQEVPKSARLTQEESRLMTDRNKGEESLQDYQSKAKKYKHMLKKMEHDAREKDQVIKDMVKSYKELENIVHSKTSREKGDSRNRSRSDLYDEVHKSISRPTKETQNDSSPNVMRSSSHIKKRSVQKEEESAKTKDSRNESYDAVKKKYKYLRGADKVKERPTTSRATLDNSNTSLTARDNSRNRSIEVQPKKSIMKSRQGSVHFNTGNTVKQKEYQTERQSAREGASSTGSTKIRVYIPFGQSPYSTYHIMKINKLTTVNELLQRLFAYFEISENRHYKYFIGVKPNEYSSETILLSSEQLGNYIEAADEKKRGSWPKFYLRAADDKYVEENRNPNVHRGK